MTTDYLRMEANALRQRLESIDEQRADAILSFIMTCLREAGVRPSDLRLYDALSDAVRENLPS